jgi:hypothetical protein
MLKFLLGAVILVSVITTALVFTRYEVHVQRRQSIEGARNHREEEHASHMRVMRLSMLLQRHLEDEVHDASVLTTYRAWLMRAVGDYQMRIVSKVSNNCSSSLREGLLAEGVSFDAEIEKLLKLLWDDIVREGKVAQKGLHNITHAIMSELRQDQSEQGEYERVMNEAGEEAGMFGYHNHEVEYHGHLHTKSEEEEEERRRAEGDPEFDENHDFGGNFHDGDDDDEEHLAGALEQLLEDLKGSSTPRVFPSLPSTAPHTPLPSLALGRVTRRSRAQHADETSSSLLRAVCPGNSSVIEGVDNETIASWQKLRDSSLRSLSDEEQEVDLERVNRRILKEVNSSHYAVPAYNASVDGNEIDYLAVVLRKARLAPFREELVGLLDAWQAGEVRISEPLRRVEELIDDEVLDPDVLLLHDPSNYDHYRYGFDD